MFLRREPTYLPLKAIDASPEEIISCLIAVDYFPESVVANPTAVSKWAKAFVCAPDAYILCTAKKTKAVGIN